MTTIAVSTRKAKQKIHFIHNSLRGSHPGHGGLEGGDYDEDGHRCEVLLADSIAVNIDSYKRVKKV
jgi:hypothetical protein